MRKLSLLVALALTGCAPGCHDSLDNLGRTGYVFSITSSIGKAIQPSFNAKCSSKCGSINSIVIGFDYNKSVIAAVRQIRNNYSCDEDSIGSEVTDEIVFEYIELKDGSWSGSLPLIQLDKLGKTENFKGIDIDRLKSSVGGKMRVLPLNGCTNPKLI